MKNLNPGSENGRRNGVVGLGLKPDQVPHTINIKVSYGLNEYDVAIPSNSNFGDLKSVIAQKYGLNLETHKLFFRGKEKEDNEYLEAAGMKDNSKVLLVEDTACEQQTIHEDVMETNVISKGGETVAKVKEEVDKLTEQISALQAVVDSGTKVEDKNFIFLSEMLMRQLLKLDGIEAEGEGRVQRKMEVRRVQSLVEKVDLLKSRNSNPSSNVDNTAPVTTQLQSSEPPSESANASTHIRPSVPAPAPSCPPAPAPTPAPYSAPAPSPSPAPTPSSTSSPAPSSIPSHVPYSYSAASHVSYSDPAPTRVSYPVLDPAPTPTHVPYSAPTPAHPYAAPSYAHSSYDAPYSYAPSHYGAPNSYAPSPHEANYGPYPYAPTPYSQTPYAPTPYASTPYAPSQYAPTPYAAPNPYDSSYYTPPHMPSYDSYSRPSYDPYVMLSYDTTSQQSHAPSPTPPSTKVTENWERFE